MKSPDKAKKVAERSGIAFPELQAILDKIPAELRPLISGNTIDLSGASTFYKKKAATATVLKDFVKQLPHDRYRLQNGFDYWYLGSLRVYSHRTWEKPAETLAEALSQLAVYWARIEYGHIPKDPGLYKQFLADAWEGVDEELKQLLKSRSLTMPTMLCDIKNDDTVTGANWREPIQRPLELSLSFATSLREPPGMTISIRGKPAAAFMRWWMLLDRLGSERANQEHEVLCKTVTTLLRSILQTVETTMGLSKAERGRPAKGVGERAAYALDHARRSIRSTSRELCEERRNAEHQCDKQCYDRIRKAATSYYKQQAKHIESLVFVKPRKLS